MTSAIMRAMMTVDAASVAHLEMPARTCFPSDVVAPVEGRALIIWDSSLPMRPAVIFAGQLNSSDRAHRL